MEQVIKAPEDILGKTLPDVEVMKKTLQDAEKCIILDIETTGFSPVKGAEIIEIGAVLVDTSNGTVLGKFDKLVKPTKAPISQKITEVTNITNEMVEDAPYIEDVLDDLHSFIGDYVVVCHNVKFDWFTFLQELMQIRGKIITNKVVCTLILSKNLHPDISKHNLAAACAYYGATMEGAHRAFVDALYTASLALRLRSEIPTQKMDEEIDEVEQFQVEEFSDPLKILRASIYDSKSVRIGKSVYFTTSIGSVYYSITRKCWGINRLTVPFNINMNTVIQDILNKYQLQQDQIEAHFC